MEKEADAVSLFRRREKEKAAFFEFCARETILRHKHVLKPPPCNVESSALAVFSLSSDDILSHGTMHGREEEEDGREDVFL